VVLLQYFFHSVLEKAGGVFSRPMLDTINHSSSRFEDTKVVLPPVFWVDSLVGRTLLVRSIEEKTVVSAHGRENCVLLRQMSMRPGTSLSNHYNLATLKFEDLCTIYIPNLRSFAFSF
jgi:hypothetical protein